MTLSSEERCRKAFDAEFGLVDGAYTDNGTLWLGWASCWRYLERKVQEEFIER